MPTPRKIDVVEGYREQARVHDPDDHWIFLIQLSNVPRCVLDQKRAAVFALVLQPNTY